MQYTYWTMSSVHPTHRYLLWLGLLAVLVAILLAAGLSLSSALLRPAPAAPALAPVGFPADAPAPTPQDYVTAQKGFQYLVSYTESGFAPVALSVKKGETIRFTNNSGNPLRLSLENAQVTSLNHAEYYEYTFANAGTFAYSDSTNVITITVE